MKTSEIVDKKRAFRPHFIYLFHSIMTYIGTPIFGIVFLIGMVESSPNVGFLFLLFIIGVISYILFVIPRLIPGLCLLCDVITNSFITSSIKYQSYVINRYYYFHRKAEKNEKIIFGQGDFLELYSALEEDHSRLVLSSARYHGMLPGEKYKVVHGKYSKVLVSIISEDSADLWDIPCSLFFAKRDKAYHKLKTSDKCSKKV